MTTFKEATLSIRTTCFLFSKLSTNSAWSLCAQVHQRMACRHASQDRNQFFVYRWHGARRGGTESQLISSSSPRAPSPPCAVSIKHNFKCNCQAHCLFTGIMIKVSQHHMVLGLTFQFLSLAKHMASPAHLERSIILPSVSVNSAANKSLL